MNPIFSSSANPEKLAATVKGVLIAIIPTIILVAKFSGWDVGQDDLQNAADLAVSIIGYVGSAVGAALTLYGLCRKIYFRIHPKQ